ncbi:restriction endonuclease subunit S [Shewanella algae]|uniref:restriction endonuclease subunit S n=1 Tax=Shewanella algae TaxID=38313 RepID=UPI001AAC8634|nr:restriction endonuclease subunit S [Shewanella algae]MBO2568878.1 restriction endonuclease subunit S [Shewanella algae]
MSAEKLITDHIDIWTSAVQAKSASGRGSGKKLELYGIKKLRELILELAVRGKLVPQDPNDEPASVLLARIAAEKARLVKEGKIKKPKALPEIGEDEKPFELPEGWEWVRLSNIADYNGRPNVEPINIDSNAWLLDLEDIEKDTSQILYRAHYAERESKSNKSTFKSGDVLYGKLRPYLNKVVVADNDGVCTTEIVPIVPSDAIYAHYLKYLLKSPTFLGYVNSLMYGVKMPRLGTDDAVKSVHPLPPLSEQHRIVAKVDELMALCDHLEQQTDASIEAHQQLVTVLLDSLLLPPATADGSLLLPPATAEGSLLSPPATAEGSLINSAAADEFMANWARISDHFDTLFTTEASIDALKQTILQLAVMGKLVPQDPSDEPAAKLLERIAAEKASLVKDKKIKKEKPLPAITDDEKPFPLPKGWEWIALGAIGVCSTGKTPSTGNSAFYDGEIPFLGPGQITPCGKLVGADKYLSDVGLEHSSEANKGDLLMVCIGGSIGKAAISDKRIGFNQQINALKPILCDSHFILAAMTTKTFTNILLERATGSATPIINRSKWEEIPIPIPPLQEQYRIVAKVDELMAICDQLKQRLSDSLQTQLKLTDVIVEQVK